ncbi:MAG: hypothetical protein ACLUJ0_08545 [Ruthenibacterium lactatiformans]
MNTGIGRQKANMWCCSTTMPCTAGLAGTAHCHGGCRAARFAAKPDDPHLNGHRDDAGDCVTCSGGRKGRRHVLAALYKAGAHFLGLRRGQPVPQKHFDEIGLFDELFLLISRMWTSAGGPTVWVINLYCPAAKCYHICGATTGAVRYNEFKSAERAQQHSAALQNMPLGMLLLNFIPLALGYLLVPWCSGGDS